MYNNTRRSFNKLLNKAEILGVHKHLFSKPRYLQIEPTNRCNQKCIMCARNNMDVPLGDMTLDQFKSIIKKIPCEDLLLNGLGEPLLNKDIIQMITYAADMGINVAINTNASLIDKSMAHKLVNSGIKLIKISMDDPYEKVRGVSIAPTIKGIKNLVSARRGKYPRIWFNSIKTVGVDTDKIKRLAEELKIDRVRFKDLNTYWAGEKSQTKKRPLDTRTCYAPWIELYIQYYGGVRLCCKFDTAEFDKGNIVEEDFKKIWNGGDMKFIRAKFKHSAMYFPPCLGCNRFERSNRIHKKIYGFEPL